jgi:phosphoribosylformylglycinamidine cyclo-ligase
VSTRSDEAAPSAATPALTYRDAGVDIAAQDEALARARAAIRATFTPGVVGDVGSFGGLFDLAKAGCEGHVLVASADGVGTKLEVAKRAGVYDTVGRDLVNHCVGDVLVQGARPLFFLDYVGTGVLEPLVVSQVIEGCAAACRENGLALLGGETAEMPGLYAKGDLDLVGFLVGAAARDRLIDGTRVRAGQRLLGLRSSGLHTNGYSLARKIVFERLGLDVDSTPAELSGQTVGEALLAVHRSYLAPVWPLVEAGRIAAMAHITGGGLPGNLNRVMRDTDAVVDRSAWEVPALFRWLVEAGGVDREDSYRAFNMGVGMVLVVEADEADAIAADLAARGEEAIALGELVPGEGVVRWA